MIHRALFGSVERFFGVLTEHYAGAFPLWLSPEQVRFVPVADRHVDHCEELAGKARAAGLRAVVDDSKESVGKKIRAAQLAKAPYTVVVGDRDIESGTYTVRDRAGTEHEGVTRSIGSSRPSSEEASRAEPSRSPASGADARVEHLWSPWRMQYIQAAKDETPSTEGLRVLRRARTRARTGAWHVEVSPSSSLDKFPYNPGHVLIVPYRHTGEVEDLTDDENVGDAACSCSDRSAHCARHRPRTGSTSG